jgi:hypothetical protein
MMTQATTPVISRRLGQLRGVRENDVWVFRGI